MKLADRGKSFETLILCSPGAVLTRVRGEARRVRDGRVIQVPGPVDFVGYHPPTGRMLVFDAKQSAEKHRLDTSESHLSEEQRLQVVAYGRAGAAAGLLVEATWRRTFFWLRWEAIATRPASVAWEDARMAMVGPSNRPVNWAAVVWAAGDKDL